MEEWKSKRARPCKVHSRSGEADVAAAEDSVVWEKRVAEPRSREKAREGELGRR